MPAFCKHTHYINETKIILLYLHLLFYFVIKLSKCLIKPELRMGKKNIPLNRLLFPLSVLYYCYLIEPKLHGITEPITNWFTCLIKHTCIYLFHLPQFSFYIKTQITVVVGLRMFVDIPGINIIDKEIMVKQSTLF